jgi:hypothetical protein
MPKLSDTQAVLLVGLALTRRLLARRRCLGRTQAIGLVVVGGYFGGNQSRTNPRTA